MALGWQRSLQSICPLTLITLVLLQSGCASLPDISGQPTSYAINDSNETSLAKAVFQNGKHARPGESGFLFMGEGLNAFVARAVLAERAERSSGYLPRQLIEACAFVYCLTITGWI